MVKNLHAMQETQVQSLSQEDPQRREWLPTLVFLPREFHGQRSGNCSWRRLESLPRTDVAWLSPGRLIGNCHHHSRFIPSRPLARTSTCSPRSTFCVLAKSGDRTNRGCYCPGSYSLSQASGDIHDSHLRCDTLALWGSVNKECIGVPFLSCTWSKTQTLSETVYPGFWFRDPLTIVFTHRSACPSSEKA